MIKNYLKYIKKIKNYRFRKKNKKQRNKLFIAPKKEKKRLHKRKRLSLHIPKFFLFSYIKKHLPYYYGGVLFFSILILFLLFIGPFFRVKNIEIFRQENISNINIAYQAVENIRGKRLLLINGKEIAKSLREYQKNIKEVSIKRVLPDTLSITIDSYRWKYNINLNNKSFILTENGVLIPTNFSSELKELIIGTLEYKISGILDYKQIFKSDSMRKIIYLEKKLSDNLLFLSFEDIIYFPTEREVHIIFNTWKRIIFDLESNIDEQIKNLLILHTEQFDLTKTDLIYIDMRIKNKIFFCLKEEEYQCNKNLENIYK